MQLQIKQSYWMGYNTRILLLATLLVLTVSQSNPFCTAFGANRICTACSPAYYLNRNKICTFGNLYCRTFTTDGTGNCASCWDSYHSGPVCSYTPPPPTDPYCSKFEGAVCTSCLPAYYLNSKKVCTFGNFYCQTFTADGKGNCAQCWDYLHSGPNCSYTPAPPPTDSNCGQVAGATCIACNPRYYLSTNNLCILGNPNCLVYAADGNCVQCVDPNYSGPTCSVPSDPYCTIFSENQCNACLPGYYVNASGKCTAGNPRCADYTNNRTGNCSACVFGYGLVNGTCIPSPNCISYDRLGCTKCMPKYYISTGFCYPIISCMFPDCVKCYSFGFCSCEPINRLPACCPCTPFQCC